jgi:hypothetical protein
MVRHERKKLTGNVEREPAGDEPDGVRGREKPRGVKTLRADVA